MYSIKKEEWWNAFLQLHMNLYIAGSQNHLSEYLSQQNLSALSPLSFLKCKFFLRKEIRSKFSCKISRQKETWNNFTANRTNIESDEFGASWSIIIVLSLISEKYQVKLNADMVMMIFNQFTKESRWNSGWFYITTVIICDNLILWSHAFPTEFPEKKQKNKYQNVINLP